MAKLSFPTSPSVNDIYTQDGISYQWDGSKWTANNDTALNLDAILANGSSSTRTLTTGAITSPTAAKAWACFNPANAGGLILKSSYNVSSITDISSGEYTINFTNAMSDANYSIVGMTSNYTNDHGSAGIEVEARTAYTNGNVGQLDNKTTTQCNINTGANGTTFDPYEVNVVVFGN